MKENWKPIPGFPKYFADQDGEIWSEQNWRGHQFNKLKGIADKYGYWRVRLIAENGRRINKSAHVLVTMAFHGLKPTPQHQVRHLNGIKTDNYPANLCWGTAKENGVDKIRLGECARGETHAATKFTAEDVLVIRRMMDLGASCGYLASLFDVDAATILNVYKVKTWRHI